VPYHYGIMGSSETTPVSQKAVRADGASWNNGSAQSFYFNDVDLAAPPVTFTAPRDISRLRLQLRLFNGEFANLDDLAANPNYFIAYQFQFRCGARGVRKAS
jgi:hypothetical protein